MVHTLKRNENTMLFTKPNGLTLEVSLGLRTLCAQPSREITEQRVFKHDFEFVCLQTTATEKLDIYNHLALYTCYKQIDVHISVR